MITNILFDLDGTLLPLDMDEFLKKYFYELGLKFKDHFSADELTAYIWKATAYMIKNTEATKTNSVAFFEEFYRQVGIDEEIVTPIFEEFYQLDFDKIKSTSRQSKLMIDAVNILKTKGYNLIVATNPLFPQVAIHKRIQWAGLDPADFSFITSFEEMHYCKPQLQFYREILENIKQPPEKCMMVGNDIEEDMIAKKIGITTYLIEDCLVDKDKPYDNIDYKGRYEDFYLFALSMPELN
ncbi:FMN phosphatase YigB, HAD superfamily [Alkaliphilus peptidifermentans DSM 18978]|uniref:FMN phosphatase YigB, HAD superfamily n=1 Tax=Alkaliphilus peptidifermentans DSM 18978 TaxID=1120976 RepID=A0A1G5HQS9_9FIRM|nr:HAD family hydrolase [Alkaliphilus peptidifermentans]SCY66107.1 FMN phosphatase YigB, HAD superfamily [Alkaliphilus peptidifermentans DSM 18978]